MKKERVIAYSTLLIPLYVGLSWIYVRTIHENLSQADKILKFNKLVFFDPTESYYLLQFLMLFLSIVSLIYFGRLLNNSAGIAPKIINLVFVILNVFIILLTIWGML